MELTAVLPLEFPNDEDNLKDFALYIINAKVNKIQVDELHGYHSPDKVSEPLKYLVEVVNRFVHVYNEAPVDFEKVNEFLPAIRKAVAYLDFARAFHTPFEWLSSLDTLLRLDELRLGHQQWRELIDSFRYYTYLPYLRMSAHRRQVTTGHDSVTGKPIFRRLSALFPTPAYMKQTKLLPWPAQHLDMNEIVRSGSNYFIFPLFHLMNLFTENEQDLLPFVWSSPILFERRTIPDHEETWEDVLKKGLAERKYSLPPEGVLVECSGYGDIVSVALKEAFIGDDLVCYGKVSFSDMTDDIVIFSPTHLSVLSSGYGDMYGYENDRVMKIVVRAYVHLISSKTIRHASPTSQREYNARDRRSEDAPSFLYLPRVYYEGRRVSPIRQRIERTHSKRPHPVIGHLRRGNPSEEAIETAKSYGITLPEGYTWVRPYKTGEGQVGKQKAKMRQDKPET